MERAARVVTNIIAEVGRQDRHGVVARPQLYCDEFEVNEAQCVRHDERDVTAADVEWTSRHAKVDDGR